MEVTQRILGKSLRQRTTAEFNTLVEKAIAGDIDSEYNLGICYLYGQNTDVNFKEALKWFEKASLQGDSSSGLLQAYFIEHGLDCDKIYSNAVDLYYKYSGVKEQAIDEKLQKKILKMDEDEIDKHLSQLKEKAEALSDNILSIDHFCIYNENSNSFSFPWTDSTRKQLRAAIAKYNTIVDEFEVYLNSFTSDTDDEKYGYWLFVYYDRLFLNKKLFNALLGRDSIYQQLKNDGFSVIDKDAYFEFALGRCLIDDNDPDDNDYIISGLIIVAGHDSSSLWQNMVGLWYEFYDANRDLLEAEKWYKLAISNKDKNAEANLVRLHGKKAYRLAINTEEGTSEERFKIAQSFKDNKENTNSWLISSALLGSKKALDSLKETYSVKKENLLSGEKETASYWSILEQEKNDNKKVKTSWKKLMKTENKAYESEVMRIRLAEERKKQEEERKRRQKIKEEERRRRQKIQEAENRRLKAIQDEAKRKELEEKRIARQEKWEEFKYKLKKYLIIIGVLFVLGLIGEYYCKNEVEEPAPQKVVDTTATVQEPPVEKEKNPTFETVMNLVQNTIDNDFSSASSSIIEAAGMTLLKENVDSSAYETGGYIMSDIIYGKNLSLAEDGSFQVEDGSKSSYMLRIQAETSSGAVMAFSNEKAASTFWEQACNHGLLKDENGNYYYVREQIPSGITEVESASLWNEYKPVFILGVPTKSDNGMYCVSIGIDF